MAKEKGLVKSSEIVAWLKTEFALGHGHANAILRTIVDADDRKVSVDDKLTEHFKGNKAGWRKSYDAMVVKLTKFGTDFEVAPTKTTSASCAAARNLPLCSYRLPSASTSVSNSRELFRRNDLKPLDRGIIPI